MTILLVFQLAFQLAATFPGSHDGEGNPALDCYLGKPGATAGAVFRDANAQALRTADVVLAGMAPWRDRGMEVK